MKKILLIAGGTLALTACTGKICDSGEVCDSGESAVIDDSTVDCPNYTGASYIGFDDSLCDTPDVAAGTVAIGYDCDTADWWYDVYTVGWTGGGTVYIFQTGSSNPWDEVHNIASYDFADGGHWDNLYVALGQVATPNEVVSGSTTLYECTTSREQSLTWHIVIYETDGATEADCAVWGDAPSSLGTGCADWS